jgi:hypothetical protein
MGMKEMDDLVNFRRDAGAFSRKRLETVVRGSIVAG